MEDQGNFRTKYNYLFNSYDRINLSDTVDPPAEFNQSMFLGGNQHFARNPVPSSSSSSVDIVRPQLEIGRQQSDYFNVNNLVNFGNPSNSYLEQSKKINQYELKHSVGNIDNSCMHQQSTALSNYALQDIAMSSVHSKSADKLLNNCDILKDGNIPAGTLKGFAVENVKVEQGNDLENTGNYRKENDQEDTDNGMKDKLLVSVDESKKSDDENRTIKEEALTDEESVGTESHEENREDNGDLSDASTIIEDEDEITEKLMNKRSKLPNIFKDRSRKSSRKTPRKQKTPKPVLPKVKKQYICDTCSKVVQSLRALIKHKNLHTENFKCKECNKIFNSAESLKNHNKVHVGYIGNEVCNVCDKTFYDKSSLKKHTLSVHMGITNFQCEYCHLSFFARKTYDEHVRVHTGEKPFKCLLCPKAYKRVADLNHHIRLHKGEVSHTCERCGEGFRRKSELNRHMNTKHSDDSSKTFNIISKEKKCQLCDLAFSTLKALNTHLSNHKLLEDIVYVEGTKPAISVESVFSIDNSISTDVTNITKNVSDVSLPRVYMTKGNQVFLNQEMSTSHVLDMTMMTYKSIMQGEPDEQEKCIQEGKDLIEGKTEKDTPETNKIKTCTSAHTVFNRVVERSNISIENYKEEVPSDETDTSNEGIDSVAADKGRNVGEILNVKSEIEGEFIDDDIEMDIDDYDADTDVEDYNYVFNVTDNIKSDIIQNKVDKLASIKVETIDHDFEGNSKTDNNHKENPVFEPKVDRVSKRKAAKPRKKVQKKKMVKQEAKEQDAYDSNPDKEEKNNEFKEKMKPRTLNDDGTVDLVSLKCLLCGKTFAKKITLKMHMHIHRGTYTCKICGKCFATNNSLKVHIDNHEGRKLKTAVCNVCDKVFYDASSVNKHVKTVHMDYRPYSCTECDRRFSEPKTLNEHMRVHTGERPFACEVCGKTFKRTSELNFHIRKHNGEVNLNCAECGKGFIRMGQLRQHMMLKHDKERPFRCFICQKTFPTPVMLKDHRKMHVILKKHVCPKCGHKFHSKSKLGKHLRRKTDCQTDSGFNVDGKFVCKYCYQEFSNIEERHAHMQEAHKTNEQRRHPCEICGKHFSRSQALKIHLKIHYQVRDYQCTMCNAAFIQRHHLTQHIATHTGSRPYQCNVCLKSFAHSATLYNHMKHH